MRDLVDPDFGIFSPLEAVAEIVVCAIVETERQRTAALEVPRHQILRFLILSEVAEHSVRLVYHVGKVVAFLSKNQSIEIGIVDVVEYIHQQQEALAPAAVAACYHNVGIRGEGVFLTSFLRYDVSLVLALAH